MSTLSARTYDAIVIGGSIGGLAAAGYVARAGRHVAVIEAKERVGGAAAAVGLSTGVEAPVFAPTLHALDGEVLRDLKLWRYGLRIIQRETNLVGLRGNGRHFVLSRNALAARGAADGLSARDVCAYKRFKQEAFGAAKKLSPLWRDFGEASAGGESDTIAAAARFCDLSAREADVLRVYGRLSAAAWLDGWFENDALKAVLGFDGIGNGLAPNEPGTALFLLWRHAQGLRRQGAEAQIAGGAARIVSVLELAARRAGVEIRTNERATVILAAGGRASGVALASGETVHAPVVFSSLDSRETLLGLVAADAIGFGVAASIPGPSPLAKAQIAIELNAPPPFVGLEPGDLSARIVAAERPESVLDAKTAALAGAVALEPPLELTIPTIADPELAPNRHLMIVSVPFVPKRAAHGWDVERDALKKRVLAQLENFAPGLKERIVAARIFAPPEIPHPWGSAGGFASPLERLIAPYAARVRTPIEGLYLCGGTAEPADGISGRAGRIAARLALAEAKREPRP